MDGSIDVRVEVDVSVGSVAKKGEIVWLQPRASAPGFTARDRIELERWSRGGKRAVIWESDPAPFAMLYSHDLPWASWAVSRQDGCLLLWDCVSLEDLGRFVCMSDALAMVAGPNESIVETSSNVVPIPLARLRPQAPLGGTRAS